jgi:hypothetical protein
MKKILLFSTFLVTQLAFSQDITTGLFAYYPFNGNANDATTNGLNATVYSATLTTDISGKANSAYYFDGSTSYIQVPNNTLFSPGTFTYSAWVNLEQGTFNVFYPIITKGDIQDTIGLQYSLTITCDSNLVPDTVYNAVKTADCNEYFANSELNDINASFTFNFGTWYHVAASYANGTEKVYVNGNLITQNTGINTKSALACTSPLTIGAEVVEVGFSAPYYLGTSYYEGKIDEVRFYNRALADADVKQLYNVVTGLDKNSYQSLNELIYPNPSLDGKMYLSNSITNVQKVVVSDMQGIQLTSVVYNGDYIDVSKIPSGIYTVQVISENGVFVGKIKN